MEYTTRSLGINNQEHATGESIDSIRSIGQFVFRLRQFILEMLELLFVTICYTGVPYGNFSCYRYCLFGGVKKGVCGCFGILQDI